MDKYINKNIYTQLYSSKNIRKKTSCHEIHRNCDIIKHNNLNFLSKYNLPQNEYLHLVNSIDISFGNSVIFRVSGAYLYVKNLLDNKKNSNIRTYFPDICLISLPYMNSTINITYNNISTGYILGHIYNRHEILKNLYNKVLGLHFCYDICEYIISFLITPCDTPQVVSVGLDHTNINVDTHRFYNNGSEPFINNIFNVAEYSMRLKKNKVNHVMEIKLHPLKAIKVIFAFYKDNNINELGGIICDYPPNYVPSIFVQNISPTFLPILDYDEVNVGDKYYKVDKDKNNIYSLTFYDMFQDSALTPQHNTKNIYDNSCDISKLQFNVVEQNRDILMICFVEMPNYIIYANGMAGTRYNI